MKNHKPLVWSVFNDRFQHFRLWLYEFTRQKHCNWTGIGAIGSAVLTGGSALGTGCGAAIGGVVVNRINKK